jgi:crossover junction endodeoxyribonuclease RuvC
VRVLGIDPGTRHLGYGLVEDRQGDFFAEDFGCLDFPPSLPIEQRLYQVYTHLINMIGMFNPQEVAIEQPFLGEGSRQFVGPALAIGQAQAAVLIAAAGNNIPVFRYSPAQVKAAVANHGAASKEQVQAMVKMALSLDDSPQTLDATDALAIALCHLRQRDAQAALSRRADPAS